MEKEDIIIDAEETIGNEETPLEADDIVPIPESPVADMYGPPETEFREIPRPQGLMYGPPERDFRKIPDWRKDEEK